VEQIDLCSDLFLNENVEPGERVSEHVAHSQSAGIVQEVRSDTVL